jgi:hypothetical protein
MAGIRPAIQITLRCCQPLLRSCWPNDSLTIYRKKQILAAEELVQHGIRGDLPQWPQPSDRAD